MTSIASLPMYDLPELRPHTDALWQVLRGLLGADGLNAPDRLRHPVELDRHWRDPRLLLSQSCGYPLLCLPPRVRVVATPCYDAPGCAGASYRSAVVVRQDDPIATLEALRHKRCALNGRDSNSGMNLLRALLAPLANKQPFFARVIETGSHVASLDAVAGGRADVAAIDCVTWALLRRHRPSAVAGLRVLDWTAACPGLPLVTAADDRGRDALRRARGLAMREPFLVEHRRALLIDGMEVLAEDAYAAVRVLETDAVAAGYPVLE